jgi:hypothetical protein
MPSNDPVAQIVCAFSHWVPERKYISRRCVVLWLFQKMTWIRPPNEQDFRWLQLRILPRSQVSTTYHKQWPEEWFEERSKYLKLIYHCIISPSPARKIDNEIVFLIRFIRHSRNFFHLFSCWKFLKRLLELSLIGRKNKEFNFSVAKFFASGYEIREWKTGFVTQVVNSF